MHQVLNGEQTLMFTNVKYEDSSNLRMWSLLIMILVTKMSYEF